MAGNILSRYVWLVDTINRAGRITLSEINQKWQRTDWSEGNKLPRRTFHNYRSKIEELFDINIECDNFNRYYIETGLDDDLRIWLLNTFTVSNLVHESHSLKNRILLEEVPSGQRFLAAIIEAMRDEVCVDMNYHPFWLDEAIQMNDVKPLCLKIFRQRWYLIGENSTLKQIRRYALDRIISLQPNTTKFKIPKTFNPKEHFENNFGVAVYPDIKPCIVKLKVFGFHRKYLQTLPLHHSQKEIETNEDSSIFQYYIAPTSDFIRELLSSGEDVEVLTPESLRNEIRLKINKMRNRYK